MSQPGYRHSIVEPGMRLGSLWGRCDLADGHQGSLTGSRLPTPPEYDPPLCALCFSEFLAPVSGSMAR